MITLSKIIKMNNDCGCNSGYSTTMTHRQRTVYRKINGEIRDRNYRIKKLTESIEGSKQRVHELHTRLTIATTEEECDDIQMSINEECADIEELEIELWKLQADVNEWYDDIEENGWFDERLIPLDKLFRDYNRTIMDYEEFTELLPLIDRDSFIDFMYELEEIGFDLENIEIGNNDDEIDCNKPFLDKRFNYVIINHKENNYSIEMELPNYGSRENANEWFRNNALYFVENYTFCCYLGFSLGFKGGILELPYTSTRHSTEKNARYTIDDDCIEFIEEVMKQHEEEKRKHLEEQEKKQRRWNRMLRREE